MKDEGMLKNRITELFGKKAKWLFRKSYILLYIWLVFNMYRVAIEVKNKSYLFVFKMAFIYKNICFGMVL